MPKNKKNTAFILNTYEEFNIIKHKLNNNSQIYIFNNFLNSKNNFSKKNIKDFYCDNKSYKKHNYIKDFLCKNWFKIDIPHLLELEFLIIDGKLFPNIPRSNLKILFSNFTQ